MADWIRYWACPWRISYDDYDSAAKAGKRAKRARFEKHVAYKCRHCPKWHLAKPFPKKTEVLK